mgnify:CR=1 FL=1
MSYGNQRTNPELGGSTNDSHSDYTTRQVNVKVKREGKAPNCSRQLQPLVGYHPNEDDDLGLHIRTGKIP